MKLSKQILVLAALKTRKYKCTEEGVVTSTVKDGPFAGKSHTKKLRINNQGYPLITIYGAKSKPITLSVHQLIWLFFNGSYDPKLQINHKDGNKLNNSIRNLELITASENIKHAYKLKLINQDGERNHRAKLDNKKVIHIRKLSSLGRSNQQLAKRYKVTSGAILAVVNRRTWGHV